ncbi:hypothetical protein REPUB_Repub04eG0006800 [Reevesia pubescens]
MNEPRCGVPDHIHGKTRMNSGKKQGLKGSSSFHAVSHYAFFDGNLKWPAFKTPFTYAFPAGTRTDVNGPVALAFSKWASVTNFTFSEVQDYDNADLKISFQVGDHGDGSPFDGPNGVLAHSFAPTDGRLHWSWVVDSKPDAFDLGTIALHEIGHRLGLRHTTVREAIMFPTIGLREVKGLNADDIRGIQALYA